MTSWYRITVTTEERVSLGVGGERAYLTRTHPFIPGAVIRGALATAWLVEGKGKADEHAFASLFTHTRFSPLFPAGVEVEPQSVSRCKYHDPDTGHDEYVDLAFRSEKAVQEDRKTICGVESLKGGFTSPGVATKISTAIQPATGTALESALFAREALKAGDTFIGTIVSNHREVEDFPELAVRVGGRRSVLGKGTVTVDPCSAPDLPAVGETVVLRTVSPTFLVDAFARPTTDLAGVLKAKGLTVEKPGWADRTVIESTGGWHMASGLPKPSEAGLAPGAVVRVTLADEKAQAGLGSILESGLGLRRSEGFGWIEIAAEWKPHDRQQPPQPTVQAIHQDVRWKRITDLKLTPEQTRWFANLLLDVRAQDEGVISKAMAQPGGKWLSERQVAEVKDVLTHLEDANRAAVRRQILDSLSEANQ